MKLGDFVEVSVSVTDLAESLPFYERLGFEKRVQRLEPWPWAVVSDGSITLSLSQNSVPSEPFLNYFAADMSVRFEALKALGVTPVPVRNRQLPDVIGAFESPTGIGITLVEYDSRVLPRPSGGSIARCGCFSEVAFPVKELEASLWFWKRLGYKRLKGSRLPYPWAIISDGLISLSLHQTPDMRRAALVYHSHDRDERISDLEADGFIFAGELPSPDVGMGRSCIETPDGQLLILLEYQP